MASNLFEQSIVIALHGMNFVVFVQKNFLVIHNDIQDRAQTSNAFTEKPDQKSSRSQPIIASESTSSKWENELIR